MTNAGLMLKAEDELLLTASLHPSLLGNITLEVRSRIFVVLLQASFRRCARLTFTSAAVLFTNVAHLNLSELLRMLLSFIRGRRASSAFNDPDSTSIFRIVISFTFQEKLSLLSTDLNISSARFTSSSNHWSVLSISQGYE